MTALDYLNRDRVHYANLLEVLRRGSGTVLYQGDDGVLVRDSVSGTHLLSAGDGAAAARLLDLLPPDCALLTGHETFYLLEAAERLRLGDVQLCHSALYQGDTPAPIPEGDFTLAPLDQSHAAYVARHYSRAFGGLAYIQGAVDRGMVGAFVGDTLAGFVGFHEEGSMGLLEVLPDYRGRGLGRALEAAAVNLALARGQLAFDQVVVGNDVSLALQRKVGLTVSPRMMFWLY